MTQGEFSGLEALEPRITPSSGSFGGGILVGGGGTSSLEGKVVAAYDLADFGEPEIISPSELHFRDADGDGVIVRFDRDVLTPESLANAFHFEQGERGSYLAGIDVGRLASDARSLKGLDITVSLVAPRIKFFVGNPLSDSNLSDADREYLSNLLGGNERAEIGYIDASGIDLGDVSVDGNLGRITAGDTKVGTAGLGSLTVDSLGTLGDAALAEAGDVTSIITGRLGKLEVKDDIVAALLRIEGGSRGTLVEGHVGGDVIGGAFGLSGAITAEGTIKALAIDGDLVGGSAVNTGWIFAGKEIKQLAVGGDILGGSGRDSGRILSWDIGELSIAGDVHFGSGWQSGSIESGRNIKSIHVEGSLVGGITEGTGSIVANRSIGEASIRGDLDGGAGDYSGYLAAVKKIGSVHVGGDLLGSHGERSGSVVTFEGRIVESKLDGLQFSGTGEESGWILSTAGEYYVDWISTGNDNYGSGGSNVFSYSNPDDPGSVTADLSFVLKIKNRVGSAYLEAVEYVIESTMEFLSHEERASAEIFVMLPGGPLTTANLNSGDFVLPDSLIFTDGVDGKIRVTLKNAS